jgi:DNA-directed RNA polymerase sigma subunit (sigma70/sigma32)
MNSLSYREREIIKLRCVHTVKEIARILNVTTGRIRYIEKLALTKKLHGETNTESQYLKH